MNPALQHCLQASAALDAIDGLSQWRRQWESVCAQTSIPIERAIRCGFSSDSIAWAFLSGYQAAIHLIDRQIPDADMASFCVTEAGGNRPANIESTVRPLADGKVQLDGQKSWLALGQDCDVLLVAARSVDGGDDPARASIRMVRVPARTAGVTITDRTDIDLIAQVPHARAQLDAVRLPVTALLPGDGYAHFVKPFRTIEDIHVTSALLAWQLREGRLRQWPTCFLEEVVAAISGLSALAPLAADAPQTHIALAGVLHNVAALVTQADSLWQQAADEDARQWARDGKLFTMAGKVRALRAERAWQALRSVGA